MAGSASAGAASAGGGGFEPPLTNSESVVLPLDDPPSIELLSCIVKSASSKEWLTRQARDVYVRRARAEGYRSRAAYKLAEISRKHGLAREGQMAVDLGAAPGSWSQWLSRAVGARGRVIAIDQQPMRPIAGVEFIQADIHRQGLAAEIIALLGCAPDLVVSDLAPAITGHRATDQARSEALALEALGLAEALGAARFLVKARQGGDEVLMEKMRACFGIVHREKPLASRRESSELYLLGAPRPLS